MIVSRSQNSAPNRQESVTERLERLRLEHRRHLRNVSTRSGVQPPAQPSSVQSNINTPSLPALTASPNATPVVDTWDDANANDNNNVNNNNNAIRPPLNGPPPPPSWLNPNRRQRNNQQSTRSTPRTAQASSSTRAEPSSIRGAGMSKKERKQRKEEEAMDKAYGNEYWYRRADDARWNEWREEAMSLVLGRRTPSSDSEEVQRSSRMFVPFKVAHDTEGVPSLFETTLKYICNSIATASGEGSDYDNDIIVDVFSSVPPHLRKSLLRYMAVHHPQSEPQLRQIYGLSREEPLIQEQGGLEPEIIISGKQLDAGILDRLNQPPTSKESPTQTSVSLLQEAKTIILFQISSLQKRQILSFPKTLTTLGLIAIPSPLSPKEKLEQLNAFIKKPKQRKKGQAAATSGTPEPEVSLPPRPTTSSSVIGTLVSLPELLPSLVTLDVSYNPWMIEDWVMSDVRGASAPQVANYGLLGRWDLRLWGRMKTLGVRGCFKTSRRHQKAKCLEENMTDTPEVFFDMRTLLNGEMPAISRELKVVSNLDGTTQPWIAHWDRELYSVGRPINIQWKMETGHSPEPPHAPLPSTSNADLSE